MRSSRVSASGNNHTHPAPYSRATLKMAATLTALTLGAEVVVGFYSGSLALLSDAGHVFTDLTALLMALFAQSLALRPVSDRRTYGLHRAEVLAAFLNGWLVIGLSGVLMWQSVQRWSAGVLPLAGPMGVMGAVGLLVNLWVAWRLRAASRGDINLRAVLLHVASDALASVAVIVGAFLIHKTGWAFVDPLLSALIALAILINALGLLRDAANLLLEGVPHPWRLAEVEKTIRSVSGVVDVTDLHVWGLCSHMVSLSAHVAVTEPMFLDGKNALQRLNDALRDQHGDIHTTLQLETAAARNADTGH